MHFPLNHNWQPFGATWQQYLDKYGDINRTDSSLRLMCACGKTKTKRIIKAERLTPNQINMYIKAVYPDSRFTVH